MQNDLPAVAYNKVEITGKNNADRVKSVAQTQHPLRGATLHGFETVYILQGLWCARMYVDLQYWSYERPKQSFEYVHVNRTNHSCENTQTTIEMFGEGSAVL